MRKATLISGVTAFSFFIFFGCALPFHDGSKEGDWYIELNINHSTAAKAITVTEYDVTELHIVVHDPSGGVSDEISWQVEEGQQSYLIPVSEQGQHEIFVTHISEENGNIVEVEESALFNIEAMIITVIEIIPGCIGVININSWTLYDDFEDNSLNAGLWKYIQDCCGGQVLEANGQLQVWGHTGGWTGTGIVQTLVRKPGWKFDLVDAFQQGGPGCQGWHIRAVDPADGTVIELLNNTSGGCTNPPNMGDSIGTYEIALRNNAIKVYKDGNYLREMSAQGKTDYVMDFRSDNMYGSGHHSHIFLENIWYRN
jgi:hypothetical protein